MPFDDLALDTGMLGSKSVTVTSIPEGIIKVIDNAWQQAQEHPDRYFHVALKNKSERDEFHLFAKAAAKAHEPALDYRKLPRPGEKDENVAFFTLRRFDPNAPRPGRPAQETTPEPAAKK